MLSRENDYNLIQSEEDEDDLHQYAHNCTKGCLVVSHAFISKLDLLAEEILRLQCVHEFALTSLFVMRVGQCSQQLSLIFLIYYGAMRDALGKIES